MTNETATSTAQVDETVSETSEDVKQEVAVSDENQDTKQETPPEDPVERIKRETQKRIDKLTARNREFERKLAELEASQVKEKTSDEPKLEDFETHEDYYIAKGKYDALKEIEESHKKREAEAKQQEFAQKMESIGQSFKARELELKAEKPDFDEKYAVFNEYLDDAPKDSLEVQVARDILFADAAIAPDVIYSLASQPEILEKMTKMDALQIAETLFFEKFKLKNAPKNQPTAKPSPPSKVSGTGTANIDPDKMTTEEWLAWRTKQLKGK